MTNPLPVAVAITGLASALLAQAGTGNTSSTEPWWIAAIVVPLAGFAAWLVKWILDRADARDRALAEREASREKREEGRAEQAQAQTRAMQEAVTELRSLNEAHRVLPDRIVERLRETDHLRRPA